MNKLPEEHYVFHKVTAFDLQIPTGSIDLLVNSYLFDPISFEDMDRMLIEFKRVLKMDGNLYLST